MGIIKASVEAVRGALSDQWLEVIEPENMGGSTVFSAGVLTRRGQNTKGTKNLVSNGSRIRVYPNQFMMLVDGGRVVDYTAEEGYYTVNNSSSPSLFNGEFGEALKDSFDRIRYGGQTFKEQKVYYINLQEIKGIKFGTRTPVNYFDSFYNAELFLRAHGTYSIKITDPLRFYSEVIPKNADHVDIGEINEQYLNEYLEAFQTAINQMSADGIRISFVASKGRELGKYMADVLDEEWNQMRGMEIQAVGIASISYDEESQKLINIRNRGAMLSDPTIREGYVQGQIAEGLNAAGSNSGGSMAGFMGVGMGMQSAGGFMGAASATNAQQMQMMGGQYGAAHGQYGAAGQYEPAQQNRHGAAQGQHGGAGQGVPGEASSQPVSGSWTCSCGTVNKGKFCHNCGAKKPAGVPLYRCDKCGWEPEDPAHPPKFCPECGDIFDENDRK